MTEKSKEKISIPTSFSATRFRLEAVRCRRGMSIIISGVISVSEFSSETISLKTHGQGLKILGQRLAIAVFENSDIEISGKIEEVKLSYGKN